MLSGLLTILLLASAAQSDRAEKRLVATITGPELKGGVVSELTWEDGVLVIQGVFATPAGELEAQYFVVPAEGISLTRESQQSEAAYRYWQRKSSRISPTGLGRIAVSSDQKLPQYGVGKLEQRLADAASMGGTVETHTVQLGAIVLTERAGAPIYDGETWGWSPPELNRVAYVDGRGHLWVAYADGRAARRILRGNFTLPAWSDDGRTIAVAEPKNGGRKWEVSLVHLPREFLRPPP